MTFLSRRVCFVHIPKTGGSSIARALERAIPEGFYLKGLAHHLRWADAAAEFAGEVPVFAIDRDPVEVAKSAYSHCCEYWQEHKHREDLEGNTRLYHWHAHCKRVVERPHAVLHSLTPQGTGLWEWYCGGAEVRRFEYSDNLAQVWRLICRRYELPAEPLEYFGIRRNPRFQLPLSDEEIRAWFSQKKS